MKLNAKIGSFLIWIFTMIMFVVLLIWMNKITDSSAYYSFIAYVWLADILLGIVAFVVFIVASGSNLIKRNHAPDSQNIKNHKKVVRAPASPTNTIVITVLVTLAIVGLLYLYTENNKQKLLIESLKIQKTTTPAPTEPPAITTTQPRTYTNTNNSSPKVDCVGPDGVHMFDKTQQQCDEFNNSWKNPGQQIINCTMNIACGGQVVKMTKNECDNSTCCEINGKWVQYPTRDSCTNAQKNNSPSINTNTNTSITTTRNWTLYTSCTNSAFNSWKSASDFCLDMYVKLSPNSVAYETCKGNANNNYNAAKALCEKY